jgi:serine/threonine-protein kinase
LSRPSSLAKTKLVYCLCVVDTSTLEPGTVVAGRYRVVSKIGHGGMGAVYHVHHVHTDESLALKVLHPQVLRDAEAVARFRREARAPARITSEHVARVTDADTAADLDGAPFYVMELLRGRDLEQILREDGPLPPALVVEYLRQAARALDKAHAIGVVHRDLKPENLFLTHREDGSPCIKLLDFGIARLGDVEGPAPLVTQVGYVIGTPNYMAPEQTTGEVTKVGPATDIWAIGLAAFKLLVGREYFSASTTAHLYAQVLSEPLQPPSARGSSYGASFDQWFAGCVSRTIEDRFGSAGDAIRALAQALNIELAERYPSSGSLPTFQRASQPSITSGSRSDPAIGSAPSAGAALPTELPAGVPMVRTRKKTIVLGAGIIVLISGATLIYAMRGAAQPPPQGIVSPSASSPLSGERSEPEVSATASAPVLPTSLITSATAPRVTATTTEPRHRANPAQPPPSGRQHAEPVATEPARDDHAPLSRDQKKRLDALDRLCNQGTFTPAECQSKRQAIIHGGP